MQCPSRARRDGPNGKRHYLETLRALIEKDRKAKAKVKAIVEPKCVNKVSKEWIVLFSEYSSIRGKECGALGYQRFYRLMFIKKSVGRRCRGSSEISSFQTSKAIKRVTGGKTISKTFQNKKRDKKHRTRSEEAEDAERETLLEGRNFVAQR